MPAMFAEGIYISYLQDLLRIFFRQSSFWIGSYSKVYLQNFWKTILKKSFWKPLLKKPFLKVGSSEFINKILGKYLQKNLHLRKLFCIYEQNIWNTPAKEFFFQFNILLVIFVIALNAPLLKCLVSNSVNHHVKLHVYSPSVQWRQNNFFSLHILICMYIA